MNHRVTVTYIDPTTDETVEDTQEFATFQEARRYAVEECKWELTLSATLDDVFGKPLTIEGDFAQFHKGAAK
jgi:hypothetical protein